ncbi:MAG: PKD domain-containing protein, partial [Bacteroidota bacterium]
NSSLSDPRYTFKNYSNEDTVYRVFQYVESYHCEDYAYKDITVYPVPNPKFELDTNSGCSPMSIGVTNNTTDPLGTYQYLWTFGDGDSSFLKTPPSHSFRNTSDSLQIYKIKLRIDNDNCFDTLVRDILAFPEVDADFSMNDSAGCHPHRVIFTNQSVNSSIYKWTFGDGFQSSLKHPFHDYTNLGDSDMLFEVKLHAESQWECFDDTSKFVTVYPQPVAEFSIDSIFRYYPDTVFKITNETVHQSVWDYEWTFGDGQSARTSDPYFTHAYSTWDTFDIQMNVYSDQCQDSVINSVVLFPPRPIAGFTFSKDTGCVPAVITFTDTSWYTTSREWNFDDGNTAVDEVYEHSFDQPGIYRVLLTVYGDGGKATVSHVVEVFPRPDIDFVIDPADTIMLPDAQIRCINLSSKDTERFKWDFGDGRTSSKEDPLHQYGPPPDTSYQIVLTGFTKYNCSASDSLLQPIFVQGQGDIDYPNIFMPGMSGPTGGYYEHLSPEDNTVFRPVTKGVIEYNLKIFNRWGELVFESNKIEKGWDGYYKGQLARQGVYVYRVEGVFSNGEPFTEVGDVTLLYHQKK